MNDTEPSDMQILTADVVSAYVSGNSTPIEQLPNIIASVFNALSRNDSVPSELPLKASPQPAVSIKKSVTPEYLISLEDGRKFRSLKRHLRVTYAMSPSDYRARWGLPADYPMVAPGYASRRSELAKSIGLGKPKQS